MDSKEKIKQLEDYLLQRAIVYLSEFTKQLDDYNLENYSNCDIQVDDTELIAGSILDMLVAGHTLAEGIFNNQIDLLNKVRFLEVITQISSTLQKKPLIEVSAVISDAARKKAYLRHKENYELKKQAIDYWCANIDLNLSNDKAANELVKIVPMSHRKLSEYVSEAKRLKIHPASKA